MGHGERATSWVLTVDQVGSREDRDRVPELLEVGARHGAVLDFDRTAGDEAQAVFEDPVRVLDCALELAGTGRWHVGLGGGTVERPLPESARSGRGSAYVRAREAVDRAKKSPSRFGCVRAGTDGPAPDPVETAVRVIILSRAKQRRTTREACELADEGLSQQQIAERLGISQQAVSERLGTGMHRELADLLESTRRILGEGAEVPTGPGAAAPENGAQE